MQSKRSSWILLFLFCFLGLLLGKLQTIYRLQGKMDPLTFLVQQTLLPLSSAMRSTSLYIGDFTYGITNARTLVTENRELHNQLKLAQQHTLLQKTQTQEIKQLKTLLQVKGNLEHTNKVVTQVVAYFPYENRITVPVGSREGITTGMPAINADGLVGTVQTVSPHHAQITLINSPNLKIGAMIQKDIPSAGLLKGNTIHDLILEFLDDKVPVEVNDLVVTSGFSEKIPKNLPIGKVIQIENSPDFGIKRVHVYPHAQIGYLREVIILK